jgi:PAS domain S-box-containing protein
MAIQNIGINKLLLLLVLVAILPGMIMVIHNYQQATQEAQAYVRNEVKTAAGLAQASQENLISGARNLLETVASVPLIRRPDLLPLCSEFLGNLVRNSTGLVNVGFADLNGEIKCHGRDQASRANIADRSYFQRAVSNSQFTIGNFTVSRLSQQPVLGFGMPVLDPSNKLIGVAFILLDLNSRFVKLQNIKLKSTLQLDIIDSNALLLVSNHAPESAVGTPFAGVVATSALPGMERAAATFLPSGDANWIREMRTVGQPSGGVVYVVVSTRLDDSLAPIVSRLRQQLLVLAIVSALGLLLAWYMSYRFVAEPLGEIRRRMGQASRNEVIDGAAFRWWPKEFTELATGFQQMVLRLQNRAGQITRAQKLAGVGFYVMSLKAQRIELSDAASSLLGLTDMPLELQTSLVFALVVPEDRQALFTHHLRIAKTGVEGRLIFRITLPDGRVRWMEDFCLRQSGEGTHDAVLNGAWQDISDRHQLQQMYAVQGRVNEMLLDPRHAPNIVKNVCNIAVDVGKLRMAWFAQMDESSGRIKPLASAGIDLGYTERIRQHPDDYLLSDAVSIAAIRTNHIAIANDLTKVPKSDPWIKVALERGYRSAAAVPVQRAGRVYGALVFMAAEIGHFEDNQPALLTAIARSMSRALDSLDAEEKRVKTELELRLLQRAVDNLNDIVVITEAEPLSETSPRIVYVNAAFERITGYSAAEAIGESPRILQREESQGEEFQRVEEALRRQEPVRAELLNFSKRGERIWLDLNTVPLLGLDGLLTHWVTVERDITERKRAQKKEQELLESFRLLFENNPQPMWVFDVHTRRFLQVNHAACQQYGYSLDEFRALTIDDIRPPAEKIRLRASLAATDSQGRNEAGMWLHNEKSGRIRHVDITTQRLEYEGKDAELVVAVDLTERVQIEGERAHALATLKKSAESLDRAQSLALLGSWERAVADEKATWSKALFQIMGRDSLRGAPSLEDARNDLHPDDVDRYIATMHDVMQGQPMPRIRYRSVHADGSVRTYEETFDEPQRDTDGKLIVVSGTVQDITHRVEFEQRLQMQLYRTDLLNRIARATEARQDLASIFQVVCEKLETLFSVALSAVVLRTDDTTHLLVAHIGAAGLDLARTVGLTQGATLSVGKNGLSRCMEGETVYEPALSELPFALPKALDSAGLGSVMMVPLQAGGETFGALIAARTQAQGFDSGACEFMRQLGEHVALAASQSELLDSLKRAYQDLRDAQPTVLQQERIRVLGHIASGIAHDINNALSPVAMYTDSLLMSEKNISDQGRQQLKTIQLAVEDVAETVARIREFYRPVAEAKQQAPLSTDVNRVVQQAVDLTRTRWHDLPQERGCTIEVALTLAEGCPPVSGAEGEIRDALVNLIINACDAMPEGGVLSITTRTLQDENLESWLEVLVADTGMGMDAQTLAQCTEPFFTTKGARGSGLGLAMVFSCVNSRGGNLHIDSTPAGGTQVRIRCPYLSTAWQAAMIDHTEPVIAPITAALKILVIDDEAQVREALAEILELDGHEVVCASNGQEALGLFNAALRSAPFSMVITDLGMPGMDGREVATSVKGANASTPVVMLTGWGRRMEKDKEIPPGVDHLICKPPTRSALLSAFYMLGFR